MKTLFLTIVAAVLCVGCAHAQDSNPLPVSSADAVNANPPGTDAPALTAKQTQQVDKAVNDLISFIPHKYQKQAASLVAMLVAVDWIFMKFGRFLFGWAQGGILNGIKANIFGSATAAKGLKLLLLAGLCSFALVGCKSYQVVSTTSATGVKLNADVPIPSTGGTMIGLSMMAGTWKQSTILQPTETNGVIAAPSVVVVQSTRGKGDASGSVTTNAAAGIGAGVFDQSVTLTGTANASMTNNPQDVELNTVK